MSVTEFKRGVPAYKDKNDNEYGLLCETKEVCVTDNKGVNLEYKLQSILDNISTLTTSLQSYAKTSDLSNYFKNTGGKLTDNVVIEKEGNSEVRYELKNGNKNVSFVIGSDGSYGIYEVGRGWLFLSDANGNRSFDGTASGNLPLTENANTKVKAQNTYSVIMTLESGVTNEAYLGFKDLFNNLGYFGFNGANNPVVLSADVQSTYSLLHTGNSAKVVISETAPSDTSVLWAW